jgi:hypothetical protein
MSNFYSVPPQPSEEIAQSNTVLKIEEIVKDPEILGDSSMKEVPKTRLNLSGIKGYKEKKNSIKELKLKTETITELKRAFDIFDPSELKLNHSVVLFVAQVVEDIFNKPKQGDLKREVVVETCKHYFNGEAPLVEMVLDLVFPKIIKTTLWRRNKQRMKNLAIFFFEIFGPTIQTNLSSKLKL